MLSSSPIDVTGWQPHLSRLQDLPVLVTHGRNDPDLSIAAGETLRDLFERAGARVTWTPFDGGHEIPLVAWRALRQFLLQILRAT